MKDLKPNPIALSLCLALTLATSILGQDGDKADNKKSKLSAGTLSGIKLRSIGPAFMSGRISDIALHPENINTWYVAAGSGNLWKTVNAGTTWKPIFEKYGAYSIGCVTVDPSQPNIVWVGTGENVGGRHVGYGDGIYKSTDDGASFKNMGLKQSEHISKILVHPRLSDTIYVAVQGPLWSPGGERGLFKSTDGGKTWKNILSKGEYTGVTDVIFHPRNPNILFAATHQRHRTVWALINGGPETGIHKSVDGGKTWRELKKGLPSEDMGKIGLGISPIDPDVVYAGIELAGRKGGFYRSANGGESWSKMSDYVAGGTGPHYYQEIYVDPHHFDWVYHANVYLGRTRDGGKTWETAESSTKHVDNHAVVFHPTDPDWLLVGCDGGLYLSQDRAKTYKFFANLPLTQFYKVDVDYDEPFYNIVGGTQDNNTQYGPSRTGNNTGIRNADWKIIIGGDGHDCAIDPKDPNIIYCESQQGYLRRYDRRTGEAVDIRPQPGKGEDNLRFNWDSPIHISPHSNTRIYFGSKKLHRTDDRGDSWTTVSPDLSRNQKRYELKIMDRVWSIDALYDLLAMSEYGNITSISESPKQEGLIYVGTDDGLIQITEDGGKNWHRVDRLFDVPQYAFVNDIKADMHDPDVVYAALDDHKTGDYKPYLVRSSDRGRTWESIAGDLPERHLVWRIIQDHVKPELLFAGTEFGVFATVDGGKHWVKLTGGVPNIPFRDLEIQRRENDLVGATFGRSFYVLDDYSFLRDVSEERLASEPFLLFKPRKALQYVPARPLGGPKGWQGDGLYTAPNPAYGATFTYYLKDGFKSKQQKRREQEGKIKKDKGDTPIPGWDKLKAEAREEKPQVGFVIKDAGGKVVWRGGADSGAGFHRVSWNLRYPSFSSPGGTGPFVVPGTYTVSFFKRVDDKTEELGDPQSFEVVAISNPALPAQNPTQNLAYYRKASELRRAIRGAGQKISETLEQVTAMKTAVRASEKAPAALFDEARNLELKLLDAQEALSGDPILAERHEPGAPSIQGRARNATRGQSTTHGPTQTQRQQYQIALEEYGELGATLTTLLQTDIPALQKKLEDAGVPWTPGRPLPKLK